MTFWPKGGTRRKLMWCVIERVHLHGFLPFIFTTFLYLYFFNHVPLLSSTFLVSFTSLFFLSASFSLLLYPVDPSLSPPLSLSPFIPSFPPQCLFHYFIPYFTSSSLSLPLFLLLLPLRLLVSLPTARRPVRFHPLPRKQGLKFKAAVVDWRQEREHRRRPGLGQNRFEYCLK